MRKKISPVRKKTTTKISPVRIKKKKNISGEEKTSPVRKKISLVRKKISLVRKKPSHRPILKGTSFQSDNYDNIMTIIFFFFKVRSNNWESETGDSSSTCSRKAKVLSPTY